MSKDQDRYIKYKKIGGWKTIEKQIDLADTEDVANYFDSIKKFSLLREFGKKDFLYKRF